MEVNTSSFAWVSALLVLLSCGLLVAVIIVSAVLVKRAGEQSQAGEAALLKLIRRIPPEGQPLFTVQFSAVKKSPNVAVLLALFLGGVGLHKFYFDETAAGIVMLLFCWTGIPAIIGFVDAFSIANKTNRYNYARAVELAVLLGADVQA